MSYSACKVKCRHPEIKYDGSQDSIICPFGFWGFKHIIEQPTEPGDKEALKDLPREIRLAGKSVFEMPVADDLAGLSESHLKIMERKHKFHILHSRDDLYQAFKSPPEPQLVYFFCHEERDPDGTPLLLIGSQLWANI